MFRRRASLSLDEQLAPPSRARVSAEQWEELIRLREAGEISAEVASKVERDMFEPMVPGQPPRLNDGAWQIHLDERRSKLDRSMGKAITG